MIAPDAKAINLEAASWIERQDRPGWNAAEQASFDAWLAQSTAHFVAYHRMANSWRRSEKLVVLRAPIMPSRPQSARQAASPVIKAAAAAFVLAIIGTTAFLLQRPTDRLYSTAVGEHQTLRLSDGSRIELNTDTVVRIAQGGRAVALERGEAFFQIVHDEARPFIVTVGDRRVVDLGTKFDIRKDKERLEVALVEGKARVELLGTGASPTLLSPGDVMVATANAVSLKKRTRAHLTDQLGWRRDVIVFNHTALADAVAELNRYNGKKIVIADPAAAKVKIGGTFPVNGTAQLIDVARDLFGLSIQDRGDEVIISR